MRSFRSLRICSGSIGRCRIVRPERKSHVLSGPTLFSQTYELPSSKTFDLHLGHGPSGVLSEKSGASPSSVSSGLPKSNTTSFASLSLSFAENGRPILLRKPSSGPTSRFVISVSASSGSIWRPPMIFQNAKSHDGFMHWNFLYFSCTSPPHFGHGCVSVAKSPGIVSLS